MEVNVREDISTAKVRKPSAVIREPVLFLIYNRPDQTKQVFDSLRAAKPRYLYIAADGPKENNPEDEKLCREARSIVHAIDWECEVRTLMRPSNLGCRAAVSTGIDWFFQHVASGIILEDDCVASPSFFSFCEQLLEHYRHDPRIMMISGDNFQFGEKHGIASYYFSSYAHIWGWATWRRAWKLYDVTMKTLPDFYQMGSIQEITDDPREQQYWISKFAEVYQGTIDTWDYQWLYAHFYHRGLSIMPNVNLITNIGFDSSRTQTRDLANSLANLPRGELKSLTHPEHVI